MAVVSIEASYVGVDRRAPAHGIPVAVLGLSLGAFFLISSLLCVLGFYLERSLGWSLPIAHGALSNFLPGFAFDSGSRFLLGVVESLAWGWYVALIFGPLYNFLSTRFHRVRP